nr:unnamed protein product [Digitaria exilis]
MWTCRSLLLMSRPRTLLNSIRGRVTEPPAVALGAASRWLVSDTSDADGRHNDTSVRHVGEPGTPATAGRSPPMATGDKKHLYLLLDDAEYGFGIHKLDMDTDVAAGGLDSVALPRLPDPPVLRFDDKWIDGFAVLGSNVIGVALRLTETHPDSRSDGDTVIFDTRTSKLTLLADLPNGLRDSCPMLSIAAGDRLYREPGWCWHVIYSSSTRWFWSCDPQKLPFLPYGVTAHAVHPSERAFFVSAYCHRGRGTFSYNTERGDWTRHGDGWELPFIGQSHYDQDLNAWVGLHVQRDGHGSFMPDGHICACDLPDLDGPAATPEWKLGKEKLFVEDPERHVDAKIVGMGGGGRFCVVEIMTMPGVDRKECIGDGDKCVLRLTAFRVEYDDDGELTGLREKGELPYPGADWGGLHCLKLQQDDDDDTVAHGYRKYEHGWSWCRASSYIYSSTRWFWSCDPKEIPLTPDGITAHAVHPSGRAFFVSVHCYRVDDHRGRGTFSYHTEHGYWTRHGDWELPFVGQAHYDHGLNAWVGLHHVQSDGHRGFMPDGHICACDVPGLDGAAAPDWKLGKEKLFLDRGA